MKRTGWLLAALALWGQAGFAGDREPILVTMNRGVDKLLPRILAQKESPRLSSGRGLFGIGRYRAADEDRPGWGTVPLKAVPTVGLGMSLNVNPVTGRIY